MSIKKIIIIAVTFVGIIIVLSMLGNVVETVAGGEIHIKQAAVSGKLTSKATEGLYMQNFGDITKYRRSSETSLSKDDNDGGKGSDSQATLVRFSDGGTADIDSVTKWRMPLDETSLIKVHREFSSMEAVKSGVRQWIIEVEKQVSSTFRADETYSTRRGEFNTLMSDQIVNGFYKTEEFEIDVPTNEVDTDGNTVMATETRVRVMQDADGNPIVTKPGIFQEYNITLVNHSLKDIDYDATIDALINTMKQAEQEKALAITNAEKAKQDAITALEQGKANIAEAEATENVAKITAVTQAQKAKEVAVLKAEQMKAVAELSLETKRLDAEAELVSKRADAEANKLLVSAGLTPQQKAEWAYKTAVDSTKAMADGIARADFPDVYMSGGSDSGGSVLDTVAINQTLDIIAKMNNK